MKFSDYYVVHGFFSFQSYWSNTPRVLFCLLVFLYEVFPPPDGEEASRIHTRAWKAVFSFEISPPLSFDLLSEVASLGLIFACVFTLFRCGVEAPEPQNLLLFEITRSSNLVLLLIIFFPLESICAKKACVLLFCTPSPLGVRHSGFSSLAWSLFNFLLRESTQRLIRLLFPLFPREETRLFLGRPVLRFYIFV